ncbi:uncharacterized protein [Eurosta solidaginis]|uniref:uncharacterized protein n=1 Tax=Eurosta solidaginis TaxID=178769 RepID=UPI003530B8CF
MKNAENLNSILEEWPLYKQSFGYSLIELDFQKLYPERTNLLFDKWSRFHQSIPFLFETHIKDANSLHIWKRLKEGIFTTDVKDCVVLYLLFSVLVPTGRQYKICPQSRKKVIIKPTISDSRNSFLIFACTQSELQAKVKLMVDEKFKDKNTVQPIICAVGLDAFELREYYIYFADIYYKFQNFVKCVDGCFKIFHVLNLKYPFECNLVWLLIQKYFYSINLKCNDKCASLCGILNDLENISVETPV